MAKTSSLGACLLFTDFDLVSAEGLVIAWSYCSSLFCLSLFSLTLTFTSGPWEVNLIQISVSTSRNMMLASKV